MAIENTAEYWLSYGARYLEESRWRDAENCYRNALNIQPNQPVVLGRLGMLAYRNRRLDEAESFLHRAVKLDDTLPESFLGLGLVLEEQGRFRESVEAYRKTVTLSPNSQEAKFHLGNALVKAQQYDEAIALFTNILDNDMENVSAIDALGHLHLAKGQLNQAVKLFTDVTILRPKLAPAHYQLAMALNKFGDTDSAIRSYLKSIEVDPSFSKAHVNLANIFSRKQQYTEAVGYYESALAINPSLIHACYNLARALFALHRYQESAAYFIKALELKPTTHPDVLEILDQLGSALRNAQQLGEAERYLLEALKIAPEATSPLINLALTYTAQGRAEEAIPLFQQALNKTPHDLATRSDYLLSLNYAEEFSPAQLLSEHQQWQDHIDLSSHNGFQFDLDPAPSRRIRVGIVSPDLRDHAVWRFIAAFLSHYDKTQFTLIAYSNLPEEREDEVSREIKALVNGWRTIYALTDDAAAQLIHQDNIDILVDLAGHTADNRLAVFARKPAPIQVTYLGYPATSGVSAIGYRLCDEQTDPVDNPYSYSSEKLVHLPHGFLCYLPDSKAPSVSPLPADSNGYITFGSFNNASKITPATTTLWAQILARTPNSKLKLKHLAFADASVQARFIQHFAKNGIDKERIEFRGWLASTHHHLEAYHQIDIALDPIIYNGTTTTCEALWMGVPVISLVGEHHAARVGNSLLTHAHCPHLVTHSTGAYIELATTLASDHLQLTTFRTTSRARLINSPLLDLKTHCDDLSAALRSMWRTWRNR